MNLQAKFPYDETVLGLRGVFHSIGERSHYINSESIQTPEKIITNGQQYLIASTLLSNSKPIVHKVNLIDTYYFNGKVHLFVVDLKTERICTVYACVECPDSKCTWVIFESGDQEKLLDYLAIKSYCQGCDDSETKDNTNVENHSQHGHDDLLEFEF
jgi:hypothetical protein